MRKQRATDAHCNIETGGGEGDRFTLMLCLFIFALLCSSKLFLMISDYSLFVLIGAPWGWQVLADVGRCCAESPRIKSCRRRPATLTLGVARGVACAGQKENLTTLFHRLGAPHRRDARSSEKDVRTLEKTAPELQKWVNLGAGWSWQILAGAGRQDLRG